MLNASLIKLRRNFSYVITNTRKYATNTELQEKAEEPQYPPILDLSPSAKYDRMKAEEHLELQNVKTVEEKIIKINMKKYYGFKTVLINPNIVPYNVLPLTQHYTRTHFIEQDELHDFYKPNEEKASKYLSLIKNDIQESLVLSYKGYNRQHEVQDEVQDFKTVADAEDRQAKAVIYHINRVVQNYLAKEENHLYEGEMDIEPRHEAYWVVGGVDPGKRLNRWDSKSDEDIYRYAETHVQYIGKPAMTIRSAQPLEPIVPLESATKDVFQVPHFKYDPKVLGYTEEYRHGVNIPGFWPGDKQEFGLLAYHTRGHLLNRLKKYNSQDHQEALHALGMTHSFSWLLAQANYQGFNTYNDVTYPLTTQTIITNGQKFSFYTYQLNTTLIHGLNYANNNKVNLCWGSKEMNLYDAIDDEGNIVNLNENVLKKLIQYYINQPKDHGINLKPYLDQKNPHIANIEDVEKRVWLEDRFKVLVSNRPRHRLLPEIYQWERIYKINHNTRPMDARRRPFELGLKPYNRRLDEHTPPYISKRERPGGPKSKIKWAKMYYP